MMLRWYMLCLLLCGLATLGQTAENQAYLGLFAETSLMKMAGMPDIELPAGVQLPPGVVLPGKPKQTLQVRLWSPSIAPDTAFAKIAPPDGLKLGPLLNLDLYRPTAESGEVDKNFDPDNTPNFTIKLYWGSSATVKAGQPIIIRWTDMSEAQKAEMREEARRAQQKGSYFYKPNWTTGYWPTEKQKGAIPQGAALPGKYALTTNYTGNVTLDVPAGVNFLAPITLNAPKLSAKIPLDKAIDFQWTPVPGVLGSYARIFGMIGQNTLIIWVSSESRPELAEDWDYMQMADVRANVQKNIFMAPNRGEVIVPAGIFKDCDAVMMNMVGYGPGAALDQAQPLPRMQTKTTLQVMLGGKKMNNMGMGGMGGGDEE
ncbi:MAG TPA: hypothetical protein VGM23_11025 [Armatimonadota bacterium]|jgi:hypothetical protein